MPPNPKQKIISLIILILLLFQPFSFVLAEETISENQSPVLINLICDDSNCIGEITAQVTEDIVGVFPFVYNTETNTALINISPDINLIYTYDQAGQRIKLTNGAITTIYPTKYYNTDGTTKTKHIFANNTDVGTVIGTGNIAVIYYNHTDHLNSANVVTDSTGAQKELLDYYPYGSIKLDQKTTSFSEQRKYIGEEFDTNTNLSYLNARYYDGKRGQFISQDPVFWEIGQTEDGKKALLNPQSQNSYSYANNNPIKNSDPSGRCVWDGCIVEATIIAGTLAMYAPQITSFAQSLMTPLGQYGMSQAVEDAHKGNYGWAVFGAVTAGEISLGRAAKNVARFGEELGSKVNNTLNTAVKSGLDLTNHAAWRMTIRNVTPEQVIKTIKNNKPIDYFHEGVWKQGFRDAISKIFVGQEKNSGRITTVINNTSSNYLSNLVKEGKEALSKMKE